VVEDGAVSLPHAARPSTGSSATGRRSALERMRPRATTGKGIGLRSPGLPVTYNRRRADQEDHVFGGKIGTGEIIIIVVVLVLLFGSRKLPELARSIGKSARELRKGLRESDDEDDDEDEGAPGETPPKGSKE
jgi:sec-independent protein translocase protein TatA